METLSSPIDRICSFTRVIQFWTYIQTQLLTVRYTGSTHPSARLWYTSRYWIGRLRSLHKPFSETLVYEQILEARGRPGGLSDSQESELAESALRAHFISTTLVRRSCNVAFISAALVRPSSIHAFTFTRESHKAQACLLGTIPPASHDSSKDALTGQYSIPTIARS